MNLSAFKTNLFDHKWCLVFLVLAVLGTYLKITREGQLDDWAFRLEVQGGRWYCGECMRGENGWKVAEHMGDTGEWKDQGTSW